MPFAGAPYQARGQSLIAIGQYDKAIEDFNAALNVNNKNADAWAGLGFAYEKSGNRTKAIESYQRALTFDPSNRLAKDGHPDRARLKGVEPARERKRNRDGGGQNRTRPMVCVVDAG